MAASAIEARLLPESSEIVDTDVQIGGVSLTSLAQEYDTPLFVYDETMMRARCREVRAEFDHGVAYAAKSFLCGAMARLAVDEGLCVDVSTEGELDLALRAGVPPERLVLHGNNKSRAEIEVALAVGVYRIVVDGFDDVELLRSMVKSNQHVDCLLRVTPGVEAHTHVFVQTGQEDTKFGLSILRGDAAEAWRALSHIPGVHLVGTHSHIGSQIFDLDAYELESQILGDFVRDRNVEEVCIGGGLGVPYVEGETAPTIAEWGRAVRAAAERYLPPGVRVTAEPGRAIVAAAAVTIYRVGAIKEVTQRTYLAVDGGMSDNPRPVLYGSGYEAFALASPKAARDRAFRIVGKHCESGDVLIDEAWLPSSTATGDLIVTPVTGAYGYSMASNYNRTPRPAVVFVADGEARLVLRRETLDDLARLEVY